MSKHQKKSQKETNHQKALELKKSLNGNAVMNDSTSQLFTRIIVDRMKSADAGEAAFRRVLDAREQLQAILDHKTTTNELLKNCRVYIFGSCAQLCSYDGAGDVDFMIINLEKLREGDWPVPKVEEDRSKVEEDCSNYDTKLLNALEGRLMYAGWSNKNIQKVPNARVPVIKVTKTDSYDKNNKPTVILRMIDKLTNGDKDRKNLVSCMNKKFPKCNASMKKKDISLTFPTEEDPTGKKAMDIYLDDMEIHTPGWYWGYDPLWGNKPSLYRIDFDVVFHHQGLRNSRLLRKYMENECVRAGSVYLKRWGKQVGIIDSTGGYLSSYAMNILWLYYLIQKNITDFIDPASIPDILAQEDEPQKYVPLLPTQPSRLGQAIAGFFSFYATEFNFEAHVISIRKKNVMTKKEWELKLNDDKLVTCVCIDDPYITRNLGSQISLEMLNEIIDKIASGFLMLFSPNPAEAELQELLKA